jgi:hypothetical protein
VNRLPLVFLVLLAACASAPAREQQYPPRPEGCDVAVFPDAPPVQTDNIGPVMATCAADISNDDCMRTLKDQACKLGADVIWGVSDVPSRANEKKKLAGRAAKKTGAGK